MPPLDGLRGVAILMVMAHNFNLLDAAPGLAGKAVDLSLNAGWIGVQLFFVLSGFLITNILISTRESANYFRSFYSRRALRIFPLYYASLLVGLVFLPLVFDHSLAGSEHQIWLWTYLSNWAAPHGHLVAAYPHMWSLAVEEQFYLVWPFLVYHLRQTALLRACIGIAMVAIAIRVGLRLRGDSLEAVYQYTICRMDALAIGAAAAVVFRRPGFRDFIVSQRTRLRITLIIGIPAMALVTRGLPRTGVLTTTYGHTLLALLAAIVIVDLALSERKDWVSRFFSWPPLRRVGLYSYSAYVIHKPLHAALGLPAVKAVGLAARAAQAWTLALAYFAIATVVTLVLSAISYHAFEMPFLKLKRHFLASKGAHRTYIP